MVVQSSPLIIEPLATDSPLFDRLISDITDRLVKEFNPEGIFLFGSHVWGTPNADSDLDLLVILSSSILHQPSDRSLPIDA